MYRLKHIVKKSLVQHKPKPAESYQKKIFKAMIVMKAKCSMLTLYESHITLAAFDVAYVYSIFESFISVGVKTQIYNSQYE